MPQAASAIAPASAAALELARFLDVLPAAAICVDNQGTIRQANGLAAALFGYEYQALVGQPMGLLLPPHLRRDHMRHRSVYFAGPRVRLMGSGLNLAGCRSDGSEFPVEVGLISLEVAGRALAIAVVIDLARRGGRDRRDAAASVLASLPRALPGNSYSLTPRELDVLDPLTSGLADKAIAAALGISPLTVHKHVATILKKMGAASRTEAASRAIRESLLLPYRPSRAPNAPIRRIG